MLALRGVTKQFGGLRALNGVSLEVTRSEIRGLIGPDGAGKTTLLNIISGVLASTGGSIELDGQPLTGRKSHEVSRLGIARTFQQLTLFGGMTVLENVMVGLHRQLDGPFSPVARRGRAESWGRDAALELLRRFGLESSADGPIDKLSVGERKRLELVRALATRPRVLLLDEPAAGLSPAEVKDLTGVLLDLRERDGITILLVEHIMEFVMGVCERITVLSFGEVLAEGTPDEIKTDPRVIEAYLGKRPV